MLRIQKATLLGQFRVQLELTDGSVVERDLRKEISGKIFTALRENPELFEQVQVIDGTLAWPNGLDLCPDMVIWGGPPPADMAVKAS